MKATSSAGAGIGDEMLKKRVAGAAPLTGGIDRSQQQFRLVRHRPGEGEADGALFVLADG